MHVLLFGATGMIGHGVLDECLRDPGVDRVTAVGRRSTGRAHPKLSEHVRPDVADLAGLDAELGSVDACLFCLGVSSAGMSEARYTEVTYDLTLAVARQLVTLSQGAAFLFVSGMGTDDTERGRTMWARVKGRTENALRALPFRAAYMFRPGFVQPLGDIESGTGWIRALYAGLRPLFPLLRRVFPAGIVTPAEIGRAMIAVAHDGFERPVLESGDIVRLGREGARG